MARAVASGPVKAPAEQVWAYVGPFGRLAEFDPGIKKGTLEDSGVQRRLFTNDGGQIIERLLNYDHKARRYDWKIVELIDAPFPVVNYRASISVKDQVPGKSCVFEMAASFDPASGATEKEVEALLAADFASVLASVQRKFGG